MATETRSWLVQPSCGQIVVPDKCPDEENRAAASEHVAVRGAKGLPTVAGYFRAGQANVSEVRKLCPLPDTAHELRCVARSLGAVPSAVVLGRDMTETAVRRQRSAAIRIIHFATHGLLAGETEAVRQGTRRACAGHVSPGPADGRGRRPAHRLRSCRLEARCRLGGAVGLQYRRWRGAGCRSPVRLGASVLLRWRSHPACISHWAVVSGATVKLITKTFDEMKGNPEIGRSEALRRSMLALITAGGRNAHPANWAPFVVVGEGNR